MSARGRLDGLLTVTRGADGELSFDALTDAASTDQRLFAVRQAVIQVNIGDRLHRAGVEPSQAGQIFAETAWKVTPLDPNAHRIEDNFGANYILAYALVILTFMAVITYGQWVATSVAEEKSSRVMELLITAATPRQLLAGKVIGNGAAGLTQYAVVVARRAGRPPAAGRRGAVRPRRQGGGAARGRRTCGSSRRSASSSSAASPCIRCCTPASVRWPAAPRTSSRPPDR